MIVAAVDQSDRAVMIVERARDLADAYGVPLHVVHVEEFSVGNLQTDWNQDTTDVEDVRRAARDVASEAGRRADAGDFEAIGLVGDPAEEITRYATEQDAEYIVVSGRKRSPVGKALFGSVTQSLLLDADRPVVAVMAE